MKKPKWFILTQQITVLAYMQNIAHNRNRVKPCETCT